MKSLFVFLCVTIGFIFSSCSSDDSESSENYLTIDGVKQSLDLQDNVNIYYNGGGFSVNPSNGEYTTVYHMVNILDPNQVFLPNYNVPEFSESLHLRFIIHPDTNNGNHNTIDNMILVAEDEVVAEYFMDGQPSVYANANQKINIKISENKNEIKFSNVMYGSHVMSGKFTINF